MCWAFTFCCGEALTCWGFSSGVTASDIGGGDTSWTSVSNAGDGSTATFASNTMGAAAGSTANTLKVGNYSLAMPTTATSVKATARVYGKLTGGMADEYNGSIVLSLDFSYDSGTSSPPVTFGWDASLLSFGGVIDFNTSPVELVYDSGGISGLDVNDTDFAAELTFSKSGVGFGQPILDVSKVDVRVCHEPLGV